MCGILGWIRTGFRESDCTKHALKFLNRRGPDDSGVWHDKDRGIWLGHVRLSILDVSRAGCQPMISRDARVVMTFNGEIYNYRELRAHLEGFGERFESQSDSEVLLAMFCRYGIDCLSKLNGIFAVAFWEQDTQRLWVARDQLGVKPLYIHEEAGNFVFSSEMKALLRGNFCKPEIDPTAVLYHLGYLWSPGETTIVKGIKKVLPGQAICIKNGVVQERWFYYELPVHSKYSDLSLEAMELSVANAVSSAVKRQLVSDVPLGAFLSGGLDSSAVAAFASQEIAKNGDKLQCFSIRMDKGSNADDGFIDDLPYAQKVAKHLDVDLHVIGVGNDMLQRLPEMIYLLDEPTADPAALSVLFIAELARANGIKVLLSGVGGDDLFTGYRRHYALTQERWWSWLPMSTRKRLAQASRQLSANSPWSRRLSKAFQYADLPETNRLISYFFWLDPNKAIELLSPEFREGLFSESMFAPLRQSIARMPVGAAPLEKMLYLESKHFLADHNLNYTDKMGMAAGVEVRVPLLDLDLIELAASLPQKVKQRGRVGKWIFKKAMEPYLPLDVIYRPKTGFGVPLRHWLKGPLAPLVDDILSPHALRSRGIFNVEAVNRLVNANRIGHIDASYTIFSIICLELWCKQYVDGAYALDSKIELII